MKSCNFSSPVRYGQGTIYGSVSMNDYGKVSISISNPKFYTAADRYIAKKLANEIVAADFIHPAAKDVIDISLGKLIDKLKDGTVILKDEYLKATEKYARNIFTQCEKRMKWTKDEWNSHFGVEFEIIPEKYGQKNYKQLVSTKENRKKNEEMNSAYINCMDIVKKGLTAYLAENEKDAIKHYDGSILNLAARLNGKGITDNTELTIKTSHIDKNINCDIHHDGTITRAWTIIASGPVQRPHYRFLVK